MFVDCHGIGNKDQNW